MTRKRSTHSIALTLAFQEAGGELRHQKTQSTSLPRNEGGLCEIPRRPPLGCLQGSSSSFGHSGEPCALYEDIAEASNALYREPTSTEWKSSQVLGAGVTSFPIPLNYLVKYPWIT